MGVPEFQWKWTARRSRHIICGSCSCNLKQATVIFGIRLHWQGQSRTQSQYLVNLSTVIKGVACLPSPNTIFSFCVVCLFVCFVSKARGNCTATLWTRGTLWTRETRLSHKVDRDSKWDLLSSHGSMNIYEHLWTASPLNWDTPQVLPNPMPLFRRSSCRDILPDPHISVYFCL